MNVEFDYDLRRDQWETLKALRLPVADRGILDRRTVERLVILLLAAATGDHPTITSKGRSVLLRGSPRPRSVTNPLMLAEMERASQRRNCAAERPSG